MTQDPKTAAKWCREIDVSIVDPDGWRYENGAVDFFDVPITRAEFDQKLSRCTIRRGYDEAFERNLRESAGRA